MENKVAPFLKMADSVCIMFDDQEKPFNIKNTDEIRYKVSDRVELTYDYLIEDYTSIFRNKDNKNQFKRLFTLVAQQMAQTMLKEGQCIYFNGPFEQGKVRKIHKDNFDYIHIDDPSYLTLSQGESDTKIFEFINKFNLENEHVLIVSLDTDVKMLSILHSSHERGRHLVVRSGTGLLPQYFYPAKILDFLEENLNLQTNEDLIQMSEALLRTYSLYGSDYSPTFYSISHSLGFRALQEMCLTSVPETDEDFLRLVVKTYQDKNTTLRRMFPSPLQKDIDIDKIILETRKIIKAVKGTEQETLPIPSTIKLQVERSKFVLLMWTGKLDPDSNPEDYGYIR